MHQYKVVLHNEDTQLRLERLMDIGDEACVRSEAAKLAALVIAEIWVPDYVSHEEWSVTAYDDQEMPVVALKAKATRQPRLMH